MSDATPNKATRERSNYLLRSRLIALEIACAPIARGFDRNVYLVGSCLDRPDYRDVDVRVLLPRDEWDGMFPGVDPATPFLNARWEAMCLAFSMYLEGVTRLPVDMQFQEVECANREFGGRRRDALGIRGLGVWRLFR